MKTASSAFLLAAAFSLSCAAAPQDTKPVSSAPLPAEAKAPAAAPAASAFESVLKEQYTPFHEPREFVIRSREEWCAFWKEAHANVEPAPPCGAEHLDFAQGVVLAAALGERRNGCFSVGIADVIKEKGAWRVSVEERAREGNCLCTMALVQPVEAVFVPHGGTPPTDVRFERTRKALPCR